MTGVQTCALPIYIFQTNKLIAVEQKKSAESIVQGLAQAAELPLIVQDVQELDRLLDGFLWNEQIQFLLIYNNVGEIVAQRILDEYPFTLFTQSGDLGQSLIVDQAIIFRTDKEFSAWTPDSMETGGSEGKVVGKVLVALSVSAVRKAQLDRKSVV